MINSQESKKNPSHPVALASVYEGFYITLFFYILIFDEMI